MFIGLFLTFSTGPAGWKWLYWVGLPLAAWVLLTPGGWLAFLLRMRLGR